MSKKVCSYKSFGDFRKAVFNADETIQRKTLCVSTLRRSYLSEVDAIYDFNVGHDLLVTDSLSPFQGCTITILDKHVLHQHGYTDLEITYNRGFEPVEVSL